MTSEVPIVAMFIIVDLPKILHTCCVFVIVLYFPTEFHAITYGGYYSHQTSALVTVLKLKTKENFARAPCFYSTFYKQVSITRLITAGRCSGHDVSVASFITD
jgi:hypothetical protein